MAAENIQYKDRLFNFLFGSEENKAWTLSLYNAVNGSEVKGMLLTEYNEEKQMQLFKEDGRREGRREGVIETLISLVQKGLISVKDAALQAGISEAAFRQKMAAK